MKSKNAAKSDLYAGIIERLLPIIFNDVRVKQWRDENCHVDTAVLFEFIKIYLEHEKA